MYEFTEGQISDDYEAEKPHICLNEEGRVYSINFPLSKEDWFNCCARRDYDEDENYYLGGCCGTLSAAQDILNGWFRMHTYSGLSLHEIRRELAEFYDLVRNHDGFEGDLNERAATDPIARICLLYERVRDRLEPLGRGETPFAANFDPSDPALALDHIKAEAAALSWGLFFDRANARGGIPKSHMTRTWRLQRIRKLLPVLKTAYEHLTDLHLGDFEGFAIISGEGDIAQARGGPAVFGTREEAEKIASEWTDSYKKEVERSKETNRDVGDYQLREFRVVPCSVSLERGVELTIFRIGQDAQS